MNFTSHLFEIFERSFEMGTHQSEFLFQLGAFGCSLHMSHPCLLKFTRAFKHLEIPSTQYPDLTIYLADLSHQNSKIIKAYQRAIQEIKSSELNLRSSPFYIQWNEEVQALIFINFETNKAYQLFQNSEALACWAQGSPIQYLLSIWLQKKGFLLAHTAAVGNQSQAVLLCGKGGQGKSTTTLNCVKKGLFYIGEDYCILQPGISPKVFSIYQSAKWTPKTVAWFPEFSDKIFNKKRLPEEKSLLFYEDIFPFQIHRGLPIKAVISLAIHDQKEPLLRKTDDFTNIKSLMMSSLKQLPFHPSESINNFRKIVTNVMNYSLTLGSDSEKNVETIRSILNQ